MPKVLVVTFDLNISGGVSEFDKMLFRYSKCNFTPFILSNTGKKKNRIIKQVQIDMINK